MSVMCQKTRVGISRHGTAMAASAAAMFLCALLTAVVLRGPDLQWLGCLSFMPLFAIIQLLRLRAASLAGGVWAGFLFLLCLAGPTPTLYPLPFTNHLTFSAGGLPVCPGGQAGLSAWLLVPLIVIPAVYIGLAACRARNLSGILSASPTIIPNMPLLVLGWVLVEAVLHLHNLFGPREGLITGPQGEAANIRWLARLLGYVCTAFVVACANALLVGIQAGSRLSCPAYRLLAKSPNTEARPPSKTVLAIQDWTFCLANPRAPPPIPAANRFRLLPQTKGWWAAITH